MKRKPNFLKRRSRNKAGKRPASANVGGFLHPQAVLPEGANLLEALFQTSPAGIAVTDRDQRILLVNPAFSRIFGYALKESVGRLVVDLIIPRDQETVFLDNAKKVIEGEIIHGTMKRLHKDGSLVYVETYAVPVTSHGKTCGIVAVYQDCTQRISTELALRQSEEVFRMLSATAPVGIFRTDESGTTTYVNQRLTELTGIAKEHSFGSRLAEALHPADRQRALRVWNKAILEGEELVDEHRIVGPKGETIWVAVRGRWARTRDSKRHSFVGVVEDITALRAAHENMKRAKEAAEAASAAKGEFLANMSHEIRTPLNGIIGMTNLALETELTPDQREYLETVKFSADSLRTVINDILDFSKIEAGKLDLETIDFDLDSCLKSAIQTLWLQALEKKLELTYEIAPDVPGTVCGDPTRLTQIVINLVGNAVKFTTVGKVSLHVKVEEPQKQAPMLHFTVADTGIGIAPEKQKLVFAPFSQADSSTTRKFGGTGLGLSISMRLVEMMQGKIWLESELGHGTRFHFTAQFGEATKLKRGKVLSGESILQTRAASDIRVLVVEDNPVNQVLAMKLLEKRGFSPTVAGNGLQALHILQRELFDIVLMDIQMPEMDGFETTAEIRRLEKSAGGHQYIVALTAHAMNGDRERCLQAGMDSYLTKPIRSHELDTVLQEYLDNGQQAKSIAAGKK